jgi:hypothetical protein
MSGLATVPVHDLQIHPRDRELIAATHGRSFWIVDVAPLQQANDAVMAASTYLFEPKIAWQFASSAEGELGGGGAGSGHMLFRSNSPPYGAEIVYKVAAGASGRARISIVDASGDTIRTLPAQANPGLNRVYWAFQGRPPARPPLSPAQRRDSAAMVARVNRAVDSLVTAGGNRAQLEELKNNLLSGNIGGFGGGGGGGGGFGGGGGPAGMSPFVARPGEGNVIGGGQGGGAAGAGEGGGGGGGGGGGLGGNPLVQALGGFQGLQAILGGGGGGGGGGFGGGGGGPVVDPGDYKIVLDVGGQKYVRTVKVMKADRIW